MDQLQQKRVNEAAEKFADAVRESYREANAELTEVFFSSVMDNLRVQSQRTWEVAERLTEQQRRQQEVAQELVNESINTYFDFLNSAFSYYQTGSKQAQNEAASSQQRARVMRPVSSSELRGASPEKRRRLVAELVDLAYQPPNGDMEEVEYQIGEFERRYETSSERMRKELSEGQRKETAEICSWLMLLHLREQIGSPEPV